MHFWHWRFLVIQYWKRSSEKLPWPNQYGMYGHLESTGVPLSFLGRLRISLVLALNLSMLLRAVVSNLNNPLTAAPIFMTQLPSLGAP
jgi:hypothetical protein